MLRVEYSKQIIRLRTLLALGLTVLIPTIMVLALELNRHPRRTRAVDLFDLARQSGLNLPLAALSMMSNFLLPIVVLVFTAGSVAEEAGWGSLRYLLLRPVTRSRLLASKLIVAVTLSLIGALLVTASALAEGVVAFGWHPILTPSLTTLSQSTALFRISIATIYVFWSLMGVICFGFMLSVMTDSTLGAVAGGIGLVIISDILNAIQPLGSLRTVLPTHHWHAWEQLFASQANTSDMVHGLFLQVPYAAAALCLAWWWFHRKDILT